MPRGLPYCGSGVTRPRRPATECGRGAGCAALLDQEIRGGADALEIRPAPERATGPGLRDEADPAQATEVMAQRRAGHPGRALDGTHGQPVLPGPDQQAHDGQPGLVAELGEDGGGGFQSQSHAAGC